MKNNLILIAKAVFLLIMKINLIESASKSFGVENYNEIEEFENQRMPNFDMPRNNYYEPNNLPPSWQNTNPQYFNYMNNPYVMPPPIYPVMNFAPQQVVTPPPNNYYYGINSPNGFEAPNNQIPVNIQTITPKALNLRGGQFNPYPQYVDKIMMKRKMNSKAIKTNNLSESENEDEKKSHNLTKELEKQIHELQKLTKEAKEKANNQMITNNSSPNNTLVNQENIEIKRLSENLNNEKHSDHSRNLNSYPIKRKSNLSELKLNKEEKIRFESSLKNIIEKLDKIKI